MGIQYENCVNKTPHKHSVDNNYVSKKEEVSLNLNEEFNVSQTQKKDTTKQNNNDIVTNTKRTIHNSKSLENMAKQFQNHVNSMQRKHDKEIIKIAGK